MSKKQTPSDFLKQIIGRPVMVKLNSGVDYRGMIINVGLLRDSKEDIFIIDPDVIEPHISVFSIQIVSVTEYCCSLSSPLLMASFRLPVYIEASKLLHNCTIIMPVSIAGNMERLKKAKFVGLLFPTFYKRREMMMYEKKKKKSKDNQMKKRPVFKFCLFILFSYWL